MSFVFIAMNGRQHSSPSRLRSDDAQSTARLPTRHETTDFTVDAVAAAAGSCGGRFGRPGLGSERGPPESSDRAGRRPTGGRIGTASVGATLEGTGTETRRQ